MRRFALLLIVVAVSVLVLIVLLGSLRASPASTIASPTPSLRANVVQPTQVVPTVPPTAAQSTATSDVVAEVNGEQISRPEWQTITALDRAMSQLAHQPLPDAESTLQRLINERLVIMVAGNFVAAQSSADQRLAFLKRSWGVDDAALDRTLALNGLTRTDLLNDIKRLLVVEAQLKQISATEDPNQWLADQRAQARIGVYTDLAAAAPAPTPQVPASTPTPQPSQPAGFSVDQQALDFALNDLGGKSIKLSDLHGHPVVINFWATWCPPCRQEVPALQAAYQRYQASGVVLLGLDLREDASTVQKFVAPYGVTYPLLLDQSGAIASQYQVAGIPTTIVVDSDGVIRARHVGPMTEDQFAQYIDPLIASQPSTPTPPTATPVARTAPDFSLARDNGQTIRLADYRGKSSVVLVFYRGQT